MPEGESPPMDEVLGVAEAAPATTPIDHSGGIHTEAAIPPLTDPEHFTSIAGETELNPGQKDSDVPPTQDDIKTPLSEILGEERKEVSQERQQKEIKRIGATVINQEITKRRNAIDQKELMPDNIDTADRVFLTVEKIQDQMDGVFKKAIDLQADEALNQPDIIITYNNRPALLFELSSRKGETYGGRIKYNDFTSGGEFHAQDIPQSEITRGILKAQGDLIVKAIPDEAAKEATKLYIDSVVNTTPVEHSEANDFIIAQAADERGILSIEDVISFLQVKDEASLSEEEKRIIGELKTKATTTNILLEDEVGSILNDIGVEDTEGEFVDFIESVSIGKIDQETSKSFKQAFQTGNAEALGAFFTEGTDEEIEAKKKELVGKIAMGGLIGLGAILALMYQVVSIESKEIKKSLR